MELNVISPPDNEWVERLRPGHWIFLVKENCFARVAHSYEGSSYGSCGQIFIHKFNDNNFQRTEQWYVRPDGCGLDYNPLIAPVEGNVPDDSLPYSKNEVQELKRRLYELTSRVQKIERLVMKYIGIAE